MNTTARTTLAVLAAAAVLAVAGCGGNSPPAAPGTTAVSPTTPTSTPSTPAAKPVPTTPVTLTRQQAGARYLTLIKPVNAVFGEGTKCLANEDVFVDGGTWPDDHPDRVVRACFKRYVPLSESWIAALQTTAWPVDAKADIADLVSLEQARLHCAKQAARAASYEAMAEVYSGCFPEDDDSADRVRARFGLPGRVTD